MRIFFLILLSASAFGQIKFEKGYLIDNKNQKIECSIKNVDWKNNPSEFHYKLDGSDEIKTGDIKSVKEFGIYGFSKYIKADVKVDRSKVLLSDLTYGKNPIWSQEKLFLKVLIAAKASLYHYEDGNLSLFFYSISDSTINQLVHKKYLVDASTKDLVATNNYFRQQLWSSVRCKTTKLYRVEKINYNKKELEQYFNEYNNCEGGSKVISEIEGERNIFNIKITPGINHSSMKLVDFNPSFDYTPAINPRLGLEFEYILPYNKNKWSLLFEPTYQQLSVEKSGATKINYSSIEFPLGLRHYFFLNENSKIFLNGLYIPRPTYNFDSQINTPYGNLQIKNLASFAFGAGFESNRISLEVRYYGSRPIATNYVYFSAEYRRLSLIVGYKLFKKMSK